MSRLENATSESSETGPASSGASPFSAAALTVLAEGWERPAALVAGGDDYELLFTAPVEMDDAIASSGFDQWGKRGPAGPGA